MCKIVVVVVVSVVTVVVGLVETDLRGVKHPREKTKVKWFS